MPSMDSTAGTTKARLDRIEGMIRTLISRVQTAGQVSSVFGRTGAVVAATNDYTWAQVNKSTSDIADITTKAIESLTSSDSTTLDVSTSKHGLFPKLAANKVYYVNNSGALTALSLGAINTVLTSQGATSAPTFSAAAGGTTVTFSRVKSDGGGNFTTTSATEVDLTEATVTFTPSSATNVNTIDFSGEFTNSTSVNTHWWFDIDGTNEIKWTQAEFGNGSACHISLHGTKVNLSAASHTIKVQVATDGGTLTVYDDGTYFFFFTVGTYV